MHGVFRLSVHNSLPIWLQISMAWGSSHAAFLFLVPGDDVSSFLKTTYSFRNLLLFNLLLYCLLLNYYCYIVKYIIVLLTVIYLDMYISWIVLFEREESPNELISLSWCLRAQTPLLLNVVLRHRPTNSPLIMTPSTTLPPSPSLENHFSFQGDGLVK